MKYLLRRIHDKLRYDIPRYFKNIWVYRKALMQTRTWDYSGSLYYLRTHLEQLEPCIRNGHNIHAERVADRIKTCKLLLDRILDDTDQYMFDSYDIQFVKLGDNNRVKIKKTPKYPEAPRESKLQRKILNEKENQDWTLLMKLLTKHQRSMWD